MSILEYHAYCRMLWLGCMPAQTVESFYMAVIWGFKLASVNS